MKSLQQGFKRFVWRGREGNSDPRVDVCLVLVGVVAADGDDGCEISAGALDLDVAGLGLFNHGASV